MGYACPVCGDPQADGEHLANHLAFTAMLGDDDHEAWLDDHAPDWADSDPGELAATATEHAEEREFPQVFEDTTGGEHGGPGHDHDHEHGHGHDHAHDQGGRGADIPADAAPGGMVDPADLLEEGETDPDDVLAEARELTRQRRAGEDGEADASDDGKAGAGDDSSTGDED